MFFTSADRAELHRAISWCDVLADDSDELCINLAQHRGRIAVLEKLIQSTVHESEMLSAVGTIQSHTAQIAELTERVSEVEMESDTAEIARVDARISELDGSVGEMAFEVCEAIQLIAHRFALLEESNKTKFEELTDANAAVESRLSYLEEVVSTGLLKVTERVRLLEHALPKSARKKKGKKSAR